MNCPRCQKGVLRFTELENKLPANSCTECGGVWINDANYWKWQTYHGATLPERPVEATAKLAVTETSEIKVCPECSHFLTRRKVGHGIHFHIDKCAACGGVWLDHNEWEVLKSRNLHDEIHLIFSEEWQKEIRDSERNDVLVSEAKHRLGEDTFNHLAEFKFFLDSSPHKSYIIALLCDDDSCLNT